MAEHDFRISSFLRAFTAAEWVVLVIAGAGAFFWPAQIRSLWPWDIAPFNAAFIGTIYLASVPAIGLVAWKGRWSPTRIVLPMLLVFTGVGAAASFAHAHQFQPARWTTWVWWFLYLSLPLNSAVHLWLYRGREPAGDLRLSGALSTVLRVQAVLLTVYFLALLVVPEAASRFWPWPVDAFHGRLYSGAFLALAVGGLLVSGRSAPRDVRAQALTQLCFGTLGIGGVLWVDAAVHRVAWQAYGTWFWMAAFAAFALIGAVLLRRPRPADARAIGQAA